MGFHSNPRIVTDGLVFAYDMQNRSKSWTGPPTTNMLSGNDTLAIYNNVSGNVSSSLSTLSGVTYRGANIWKQTLTPLDATGVSYLTSANNPGIGVYSAGGGGTANRYTGHSIFFKPLCRMSTTPIYTHYSNIQGWQSSTNYDDVGDGWYRAHVIWYDTVTRSDAKYWAINPDGAVISNPMVILWAGAFKEDRNSQFVGQYVLTSRGSTDSLFDLTGRRTITIQSLTYANDGTFNFNGTSDYLSVSGTSDFNFPGDFAVDGWIRRTGTSGSAWELGYYNNGILFRPWGSDDLYINGTNYGNIAQYFESSTWRHYTLTRIGTACNLYVNGNSVWSATVSGNINSNSDPLFIGKSTHTSTQFFTGSLGALRIYKGKGFTQLESQLNFISQRSLYGV